MILGLQIIAIIFSLLMIYFAVVNFNRGEINSNTDIIRIDRDFVLAPIL